MRTNLVYLICGIVGSIAGCSTRAEAQPRPADGPGEVVLRVDKDALRGTLTPARQVSVVGTARISVAPDVADISMGVTTARPTAPEAVADNNRAMTVLVEAIKRRGVAAKDIQTSHISITPQYSRPMETRPDAPPDATVPRAVGYEVTNTVRITARDPARIGDLVDAGMKAGSNQLYGIAFRSDDREAVMADLRAKAFDAARRKAEFYAGRSGMELGPVVQITESDQGWMAISQAPMGYGFAPAPAAPSMPVSAGEQEMSLSVTVSYELKLPR